MNCAQDASREYGIGTGDCKSTFLLSCDTFGENLFDGFCHLETHNTYKDYKEGTFLSVVVAKGCRYVLLHMCVMQIFMNKKAMFLFSSKAPNNGPVGFQESRANH